MPSGALAGGGAEREREREIPADGDDGGARAVRGCRGKRPPGHMLMLPEWPFPGSGVEEGVNETVLVGADAAIIVYGANSRLRTTARH